MGAVMNAVSPLAGAQRVDGWEPRFHAVIEASRGEPYVLGEFDCFRFACRVIEALTGIDRWPEFSGRYTTRREAMRALHAYGASFTAAATAFFGSEPQTWKRARRGDILEYRSADGEAHLAVGMGTHALVCTDAGLLALPLSACLHCWRIG